MLRLIVVAREPMLGLPVACRDTCYRYQQAVEDEGFETLVEKSRRKPTLWQRQSNKFCRTL